MLLCEFDPSVHAVIDPEDSVSDVPDFPETVVAVFSHQLFRSLVDALHGRKIAENNDVDGDWPVYEIYYNDVRVAFCKARLGAPACVGRFEEIIALGAKRIILVGNCGVLDHTITDCSILIPTAAIRDEGTSYHYAPPSDIIPVNTVYRKEFQALLSALGYTWTEGITWTTDAFFRETPEKVASRKKAGAICVEMECAAMQAMCNFRNIAFFQFLYAGDNLDTPVWDPRSLSGETRLSDKEKIVMLAFELASRIADRA